MRAVCVVVALPGIVSIPAEPQWYDQLVDHFSTDASTFRQRYYMDRQHFQGPGSPIFVILGGEGGIPPATGIYYPWVADVLAKRFGAMVVEPEHRFYGESLPFGGESFAREHLRVMNTQQALADAAAFVRFHQSRANCTPRGTPGYCPVLTIGGSYPGFLSAMMRLRYPAVVDMAYAASAPMRFYSQQVGQDEYYARVTASAERAVPGCPAAVRRALEEFQSFFQNATLAQGASRFGLCEPLPAMHAQDKSLLSSELLFLAEVAFANLNMANYPPTSASGLARACATFVAAAARGSDAQLDAIRDLLAPSRTRTVGGRATRQSGSTSSAVPGACFNLSAQLPGGSHGTARCGDWSGCGVGRDGEMWDYQTCTFEVERIGFNASSQMFPSHAWSPEWLREHCARRFGVVPRPRELTSLWGFDADSLVAQTSKIIFTNGLNDGWSVGGFPADLSARKGLLVVNLPNGAHHSDLDHGLQGDRDTPDVVAWHARAAGIIEAWLAEVRGGDARHGIVV